MHATKQTAAVDKTMPPESKQVVQEMNIEEETSVSTHRTDQTPISAASLEENQVAVGPSGNPLRGKRQGHTRQASCHAAALQAIIGLPET